jgi:predicted TPR repeat methyltransferase
MTNNQERYDKWASTYDKDVQDRIYSAPEYMVAYLMELLDNNQINISPQNQQLKVLDAGCGTGLVGVQLKKKGFEHIDGVDYSEGMVREAYKTGIYKTLIPWCDLNSTPPFFLQGQFDFCICCGVFSFDLVKPTALEWLMDVTKPGGVILMSVRPAYYDKHNFGHYCEQLEAQGKLKLIDKRLNKSYLGAESEAHYLTFVIPNLK